jgi:hypothetical protein
VHSVSLNYNKPPQTAVLEAQSVLMMFDRVMNEIRSVHAYKDGQKLVFN